jgi:hypothetical protein
MRCIHIMPRRNAGNKAIVDGLRSTVTRQQEELEYMRMSMFWEVQGPIAMQMAMTKSNAKITKCRCAYCYLVGRTNTVSKKAADCKFIPFFEECMKTLGIVVLRQPTPPFKSPEAGDDAVLQMRARCVDAECHLVEVVEHAGDKVLHWADFKYGALVWRAKRENDKEIKKMIQLIAVLSGIVGPVAALVADEDSEPESDEDDASYADITGVASDDAKKGSDEDDSDYSEVDF